MKPLEGLLVLEFAQFMAAPTAGLRLADLGARVIKIERPVKGEAGRQIAIRNIFVDGSSLVFHTINRNKESYAADLKNPADLEHIKKLIAKADIITHNFRPGVMEKIGLGYESVRTINPRIVYGVVTGYGSKGPWALRPGQDLLIQSLSGLAYLSDTHNSGPVSFGLATADMICGAHFVQGLLAALLKRAKTNNSVLVEVSLLESVLDLQFEVITTHLNDGGKLPQRSQVKGNGHPYLSAPYGIYKTSDGYLSLAMGDLHQIGDALGVDLRAYADKSSWFDHRDEIMRTIAQQLSAQTTGHWLAKLETKGIWCAEVLTYEQALQHEGYLAQGMKQEVTLPDGSLLSTTRCPIRINGERLYSDKAAPRPGADTDLINQQFELA
ncbi:carnitine dehydratase [Mucilaginibacter sp. PPCGB 2223]|uniref:CaiB/BaiF CoA transferase family protein n=1 Tax=Mucilaginibacter sp. PPCGB 2223 TaxID=1886027 RepID=UPI0008262E0A|nr:CaiB/BaiF CoA-transferase family protein [Mucilaginibacter sp. PPCGB 2223]OCX53025.1 carnitine dehydratase [Mucilaginibacter sp. PPCGB 2223]